MSQKDKEGILFSTEEMNNIMADTMKFSEDKPETIFGMTFKNAEERRAYFREELRKKLSELKKIEGFPIGSDEDILNLSDPPYYTACPNPWLNLFVEEWEKEKTVLEKEGKRSKDFEVKEPYAYGIMQGKNSAIYNAHTYHTKVPYEVIMRYILYYTQPGDIVYDGFAGTGMTGVAASSCENPLIKVKAEINNDFQQNQYDTPVWGLRHSICGDLSPLCYHISSNYNSSVDVKKMAKVIDEIITNLQGKYGYLYEYKMNENSTKYHVNYYVWSEIVSCKNCGRELNVHDLSFDYTTKTLKDRLVCPYCGTEQKRTEANSVEETIFDEQQQKSITQLKYECCLLNYSIPKKERFFSRDVSQLNVFSNEGFVPDYKFGVGDKFGDPKRVGIQNVGQLYYPRTKQVLGYLYSLIHTNYQEFTKPLMFIFTSMLPKLNRFNRYMPQHGSRALVGPMANTLYVPSQGVENNPIDQFEYQANKVLKAFEQCKKSCVVQVTSATSSDLPDDSVDYIFTDPPFGANIMYSELNTVSESWLKLWTNNQEEAISNRSQHKGLLEYQSIMAECFKEYERVLKPGKWLTIEFSNTSASFWNALQYAIKDAGFIISTITDLNKERGGLHAMLGPTAVKKDLAISCYKPSVKVSGNLKQSSIISLWELVSEYINKIPKFLRANGKTCFISERDPRFIYDRVISYFIQANQQIPLDAKEFQQGLRERFVERDGMFFTAAQAAEYEEKKKSAPEFVPMGIIVSDEANGIQWLKNQLRNIPKTYQELQPEWMQAINGVRKHDILPELKQLLEENFIELEDGKWRLPNIQDDVDKEALRTKALLREFKIYVEQASKPKGKIKEARVEALRAGFKDCYVRKDFKTIVMLGDKIPQNLRDEDDVLLQFYDIAQNKI